MIVPVWNPGEEIIRCIDTLRNQTLRNIEMLFIDDCGTDDSMEHVARAAEEDPRIRIIRNPENLGVGAARNIGIDLANGLYLSFVDPDDYLAEDFLETL
ncbi:MAG: glycosyltransferase family 2 protein, partial [Atopobiaceae bacterium]|nr:glycosyltransferase family 2 protein [Atopobiaceae bacterium]